MSTAGPLTITDLAATVRASIHGDVVTPEEPSFAAATFGVRDVAPEIVVIAADAGDVAKVVRIATRAGRRVVAQIAGRPTVVPGDRTILVVTRLLAAVRIDAGHRTATVGIGASWRQLLDAAEPFGLTALSAAADTSARTAGGSAHRSAGFTFAADRIRSFEVVTGTGDRRVIGPDSPDFAALRQGRTAPGLVVAMTLDLIEQPALLVAELTFAADDAERVVAGWRNWSARLPRTVVTGLAAGRDGDSLIVRVAQVGDGPFDVVLATLRAAVGITARAEAVGASTVAAVAGGRTERIRPGAPQAQTRPALAA